MNGGLTIRFGRAGTAANALIAKGVKQRQVTRIMQRDSAVFSANSELRKLIDNRLGWADIAGSMGQRLTELTDFRNEVLRDCFENVVVVGMGGSSLCPDLLGQIFRPCVGVKSFAVLDSTAPQAIRSLERRIDYPTTLFIIASKSGTTIETRSHEAYVSARIFDQGVTQPGRNLVAITDPGSALEAHAKRHNYRKTFLNAADIGGRFSALSYFGLVPALFTGAPVGKMLANATAMEQMLRERSDESNPALLLGSWMAACYTCGADKLLFGTDKKLVPFVAWLEQLIAESLGKKGKGLVPIEADPVGTSGTIAKDRAVVEIRLAGRESKPMPKGQSPAVHITLDSLADLGGQFLLWEAAVAAAGAMMKINPFDEPNVTESKNNTSVLLEQKIQSASDFYTHRVVGKQFDLLSSGTPKRARKAASVEQELKRFFTGCRPPSYVAILVFDEMTSQTEKSLAQLRIATQRRYGVATLRGYGPRYLHSIGQLYKGGPATGRFIVILPNEYPSLPMPGQSYGFEHLVLAQALGDSQALSKRHRPLLLVQCRNTVAAAVKELANMISKPNRS